MLNFISSSGLSILPIRAGGVLFTENIMSTRIRNIWSKIKKWLQYHPEKHYFRGE